MVIILPRWQTKKVSRFQPQKALKCKIFQQQSPEFAVLMALIYAHLDVFFFFFIIFCTRCVFKAGWFVSKGQWWDWKAQSLQKERQEKRRGRLAELCLYCDISLGVTEKYDFSLLSNNAYQQPTPPSTVWRTIISCGKEKEEKRRLAAIKYSINIYRLFNQTQSSLPLEGAVR